MTYEAEDLDLLIEHRLELAMSSGRPPVDIKAWSRKVRSDELANERTSPGFITKAAAGLREIKTGVRITGWRETRGTHGIDHLPDPKGTDIPPWL